MRFAKLAAYIDTLPSVGVPGCDLIVYRDHEQIFRRTAGFRDAERTQPMRGDETYWLFSCSKVFTTCAAMQLIEAGKLHPDDLVSAYLPAYAELRVREADGGLRPARRQMTVRHLLSMQSGLDYDLEAPAIRAALERTGGRATTREIADALASAPLQFDPGEDFLYSLSHDVLAAVIEVASGERFSAYLQAHILLPLGIRDMGFALTDDLMPRQCAIYQCDESGREVLCPADSNNYRLTPSFESGGAGLIASAEDVAAFADALACGGVGGNGARLLLPETIQLWTANQLGPKARRTFDLWNRRGYSYALGVRTRVQDSADGRGQLGEFGWDGAAGSWVLIDPVNHISAFYAMHVRNFGYCYEVIHPKLRELIYEALWG